MRHVAIGVFELLNTVERISKGTKAVADPRGGSGGSAPPPPPSDLILV